MLNEIQHIRLLDKLKSIFIKRANWNKESAKWIKGFETLSENEKEELLIHFYRIQGSTIIKKMNAFNSNIHIPHLGNFTITAQQMYCIRYKEELKKYTGREKQEILNVVFGTYKTLKYNPCTDETKLSIHPSTAKGKTNIL